MKKKLWLGASILAVGLVFAACDGGEDVEKKSETTQSSEANDEFAMNIPLDTLFSDEVPLEFAESIINTELQPFELDNLYEEGTINSEDFIGKPFIVKYAYSGCSACQQSQPEVEKFISENPDIPLIQIFNDSDTKETVDGFLAKTNTFEQKYMAIDNQDTQFAAKHNINYTPTFLFVDHTGVIRFATIGSVDITRLESYMDLAYRNLPSDVYTPRAASTTQETSETSPSTGEDTASVSVGEE